ncbi:MAG: hypothetical protein HW391_1046 [Chloroflexi bacterium]|nr:hypothetical protein [Chloroflexota bacterium]
MRQVTRRHQQNRSAVRRPAPGRPATARPASVAAASTRPGRTWLLAGSVIGFVALGVGVFLMSRGSDGAAGAWSRLGTEDVHSLAFVADDPNRLLFGHHGGILASADGGRSWQPLGTRSDAMGMGPAADGSIVIAGHEVFAESRDEGRTWQDIPAALPSLDIHGFTRDPGDPARMWAYIATGGLWESRDTGRTWEQVVQDNVLLPVAVNGPSGPRLFGLTAGGLATSTDGGRTWGIIGGPEIYPIASLAATTDGSVLVAGGPTGLARSADGGATWSKLPFEGQPLAIALTGDGRTIAMVTIETDFFRSDDGGLTWPAP